MKYLALLILVLTSFMLGAYTPETTQPHPATEPTTWLVMGCLCVASMAYVAKCLYKSKPNV